MSSEIHCRRSSWTINPIYSCCTLIGLIKACTHRGFLTGLSEPFFFICTFSKLQLTDKTIRNVSFLMLGFKPQVSGTEIECSGSCATAHYLKVIIITPTWTSNAIYSWCTLIGIIKACTHRGLFNWSLQSFFSSFAPFPNCN